MKAVAYVRVSDASQIEGHSLDAQERLSHNLLVLMTAFFVHLDYIRGKQNELSYR